MHVGDDTFWSIGEVSRKTGLTVKLIRHWSDIGVVHPARRTSAGYRVYGTEAVARLQLARTLRDLGLGLATIRDVLEREPPWRRWPRPTSMRWRRRSARCDRSRPCCAPSPAETPPPRDSPP
ncbi:MerR family transcriptional regulator [Streptomyces sp. NPDC048155]|uniref:helix-turn-helix domain-containing protein n=1 Tax=Streptomyces sp. NPDC048155 TaxID=3154818 RepID=UPI00340ACACD